ncbi:hypothetical protein PHLCEN_2v8040 [Hermanssonia centrifuga]|uniref:Uncharacterized protein n=1 Tax=Hermanssonia centrifuga TaxID=98765 RepID=A0A2R6NUS3_9APHY|nr:hypothetical protein PHLCEN_2v8040 [Hermanssonia centrifuga]
MNATQPNFLAWESEPTRRGTYNIISTCLITLVFCVWSSVHIDIVQSQRNAFIHKLFALMLGLLAPEVLLATAFLQRNFATQVMNEVNKHFTIPAQMPWYRRVPTQLWTKVRTYIWSTKASDSESYSQFHPDSEKGTSTRVRWTLVHGFYAVMGGFVFDASTEPKFLPNSYTRAILTPAGLRVLLEHDPELIPDLSEAEIMDKSKADGLAKALLLFQALWFCTNCVSRLAQGLPLSLLEVTTFAHAFCTFFTYLLWWHKPLNIREPTLISGERAREVCAYMWMASRIKQYRFGGLFNSSSASEFSIVLTDDGDILMDDGNIAGEVLPHNAEDIYLRIWGRRPSSPFAAAYSVKKAFKSTSGAWYSRQWDKPFENVSLTSGDTERWALASKALSRYGPPSQYLNSLVHGENEIEGEWDIDSKAGLMITVALLTAIYGAPHVAAWDAPFATRSERVLWRSAAVVITTTGTAFGLMVPWLNIRDIDPNMINSKAIILGPLILGLICIYPVSAVYLLVESFKQLSHLPPETYQLPSWSNYFPHSS